MSAIDDRLRSELSADDEAFLSSLDDEPGLFAQLGATFHGPLKYWSALAFVFTFAFIGLAGVSVWQLVETDNLNAVALWLGALTFSVLAVGLLKMWLFMRMNHLVLLKEIKRLQIAVAQLKVV